MVWTGSDGLPAWSIRISLRQEISGMRQISTQEMELACPKYIEVDNVLLSSFVLREKGLPLAEKDP